MDVTIRDLIAKLQSIFDLNNFFVTTGFTTIVIEYFTFISAFLFIQATVQDKFSAFIGAIIYGTSTIVLMRVAQLDNALLGLCCTPLLLFFIKRVF